MKIRETEKLQVDFVRETTKIGENKAFIWETSVILCNLAPNRGIFHLNLVLFAPNSGHISSKMGCKTGGPKG